MLAGINARRAARAHTLFNAVGVLWIAVLFQPFLSLVDAVVPGTVTSRVEITAHLAMFHTMFNVANTGLCVGFVPYLERIVCRLVRRGPEREPGEYAFPHVRTGLPDTVQLDVMAAQADIGKMAELVERLFGYFLELFENSKKKIRAQQKEAARKVALASKMQEEITAYLVECSRETISESLATTINSLVRIVTELDSIVDTTNKLITLAQQKGEKDVKLDRALVEGILPYAETVQRLFAFNKAHLRSALTRIR